MRHKSDKTETIETQATDTSKKRETGEKGVTRE